MRELFQNTVGNNTAEITVKSLGKEIVLHYHLNDNPVQHAWQNMYSNVNNITMGYSNKLTKSDIINEIRTILPCLGNYTISDNPTQTDLNNLHTEFVNHEMSDNWQRINLLIHQYENITHGNGFEKFNGSLRFFMNPEPEYFTLQPEHKLWLTSEKRWGDLLAGYATKGKGWWEISRDNDGIDDLNPQTKLGTETIMIFEMDTPTIYNINNRFYQWSKTTNLSVPKTVDELSLGRYYLGNLIITDTFTNYHNNTSDWYVPNHKCRLQWTKDIIGVDATITNIKLFNSDLYYDTILKHTEILECIK